MADQAPTADQQSVIVLVVGPAIVAVLAGAVAYWLKSMADKNRDRK
jgi:hypothetical protein